MPGFPAARIGDVATGAPHCHSAHPWSPVPHPCTGPIDKGEMTVLIEGPAAARLGDTGVHMACCGPNKYVITSASATVLVGGMAQARALDQTQHCGIAPGKITKGAPTVFIG